MQCVSILWMIFLSFYHFWKIKIKNYQTCFYIKIVKFDACSICFDLYYSYYMLKNHIYIYKCKCRSKDWVWIHSSIFSKYWESTLNIFPIISCGLYNLDILSRVFISSIEISRKLSNQNNSQITVRHFFKLTNRIF